MADYSYRTGYTYGCTGVPEVGDVYSRAGGTITFTITAIETIPTDGTDAYFFNVTGTATHGSTYTCGAKSITVCNTAYGWATSGRITVDGTGLASVSITEGVCGSGTLRGGTNADGYYLAADDIGGHSPTLNYCKAGYCFSPLTRSYSNLTYFRSGEDCEAALLAGQPTNFSPTNGSTTSYPFPTQLSWTADANAVAFDVWFQEYGTGDTKVSTQQVGSSWGISPVLQPSKTYSWKVDSYSNLGCKTTGGWKTFATPSPSVSLVSPADDSTTVKLTDTLQAEIETLGLSFDSAQLYINDLKVYDGAPVLEWTVGDFCEADTEYTWKVVAAIGGVEFESETWTFTTIAAYAGIAYAKELTVWFSATGDYDNFEEGVKDADSFSLVVPSANEIAWVSSIESILLATFGDIWEIGSNKIKTPLTPTNFTVSSQCAYGALDIQPVEVDKGLLFVDSAGRKVRELVFEEDKYVANDMTSLSEHITLSGIVDIGMQYDPDQILWCALDNGDFVAMVYERQQNVVAWFKAPIDGLVQSVCVGGNSETEDEVYIAIKRTINSEDVIYIEKMAPRIFTALEDAFFVDCGITFTSGSPTTTVSGLDHLIDETVVILADGVVQTSKVVDANGEIELDTAASTVQAGLPYTSKLEPLKPVVHTVMGTSAASIATVKEMGISLYNSAGVKVGTSDDSLFDVDLTDSRWVNLSEVENLFTGTVVVSVAGGFSLESPLIISSDSPLPCCVRALIPRIDISGR